MLEKILSRKKTLQFALVGALVGIVLSMPKIANASAGIGIGSIGAQKIPSAVVVKQKDDLTKLTVEDFLPSVGSTFDYTVKGKNMTYVEPSFSYSIESIENGSYIMKTEDEKRGIVYAFREEKLYSLYFGIGEKKENVVLEEPIKIGEEKFSQNENEIIIKRSIEEVKTVAGKFSSLKIERIKKYRGYDEKACLWLSKGVGMIKLTNYTYEYEKDKLINETGFAIELKSYTLK